MNRTATAVTAYFSGIGRKKQVKMKQINIVLVQPEIPQNTGNIARTCAAIGASLHLVRPLGFAIDDRKLKRAGLDYWDKLDITYYDSLADFLDKTRGEDRWFFTTKAQKNHTQPSYAARTWLVFGRETKGLPEDLLFAHSEQCVRIPMRKTLRSLNLSNSVAVAAYEVLRQDGFESLETQGNLTEFDWADAGLKQM